MLNKAKDGVLAGYTCVNIDTAKFAAFKQACYEKHVTYSLGAKDPNPGSGKIGRAHV